MDAGAYYDPTLEDKNARMKYLQERIDALTEQMKLNFKPLKIETRPVTIAVQNFQNKNKEETNGFIARSYYYPVGDSPKSVVDAPKGVYSPKEAERKAPVQAKQVKPVELPGLKNIPAKEVSRDQLVQQKEATATNDANDVAKRVTSNTELKGYKTVATNAPKVNIQIQKGENEPTFIISNNSEKTLINTMRLEMIGCFILGSILFVAGIIIILKLIGAI